MKIDELTAALQLASSVLPIGAFSYSQGLEAAVETGLVQDEATARSWIAHGLLELVAPGDAAVVGLQYAAWCEQRFAVMNELNAWFLASRESAELRRETEQMGWSLRQLAFSLGWLPVDRQVEPIDPVSYPTWFAVCGVALGMSLETCLTAFCFAWLEGQVLATMKAVPLGQVCGQRILQTTRARIPAAVHRASITSAAELISFAPMLGILSSRHETQYSRIFRS